MKDHIKIATEITLDGDALAAIETIKQAIEGVTNATIETDYGWMHRTRIITWRPMTELELSKQREKKERRAFLAEQKREKERTKARKFLEESAAKYGLKLVEVDDDPAPR